MQEFIVIPRNVLIGLCPYEGGDKECRKHKGFGCHYYLGSCHFDDMRINFDDDDAYETP